MHNDEKWGSSFFTEQIELFEDIINLGDEVILDKKWKFKDFKKDIKVFKETYLE